MLRILPIGDRKRVEELFGPFQGQLVFREDINAPTVDEWAEA